MAKCKHETQNGICEIHSAYSYCHLCDIENLCKGYDPQTNADRIRAMSDEELAIHLHDFGWDCHLCSEHERLENEPLLRGEKCDEKCMEHCLEWLKQPVEVDND